MAMLRSPKDARAAPSHVLQCIFYFPTATSPAKRKATAKNLPSRAVPPSEHRHRCRFPLCSFFVPLLNLLLLSPPPPYHFVEVIQSLNRQSRVSKVSRPSKVSLTSISAASLHSPSFPSSSPPAHRRACPAPSHLPSRKVKERRILTF